jgi:lipopolysaccharide/colanic/teichoic acid biosynthesis glycosyltransferase
MYKRDVAKNNSTFKIIDDPRVTKVGKFIRNTSIDELPQLINVLKEICL